MRIRMTLTGDIEETIDQLIEKANDRETGATEEDVVELGKRCGILAVGVCGRPGESDFSSWEPADGDCDALCELLDVAHLDDVDDDIYELFHRAYCDGVSETVDGLEVA